MDNRPEVHVIDQLERAVSILHPLRLRILSALAVPDSSTGLGRRFGLSRQQVNYHLRQMEAAGLVELVGERRVRGCTERLVQAVARSFVLSSSLLGDLAADPQHVDDSASNSRLVAAAARAIDDVEGLRGRLDPTGRPFDARTVQAEVRLTAPGLQRGFMEELSNAVDAVVAKYHDGRSVGGRRVRVLVGAYPVPDATAEGRSTERRPWSSQRRNAMP